MTLVWSSMNVTNHLKPVIFLVLDGPIHHYELARMVGKVCKVVGGKCSWFAWIIGKFHNENFLVFLLNNDKNIFFKYIKFGWPNL